MAACLVAGLALSAFHGAGPARAQRDAADGQNASCFDVRSFGAIGDEVHDDTAAFQAAFAAAAAVQGRVLIPSPAVAYKLTAPVFIRPITDRQLRIDVDAVGGYASIAYRGPSTSSVFITYGLKDSVFSGVKVQLARDASNVVVWDMRCSEQYSSNGNVLFRNCFIEMGGGGRNIGWRSTPGGGFGDFAALHWQDCYVQGLGTSLGDIAWQNGTTNSLPWTFINCFASTMWRVYLSGNVSTNTTADVAADADTIEVDSTTGFPPAGRLKIGGEQITYSGTTPTRFTGCARGANDTKAAAYEGYGYVVDQYQAAFGGALMGGMSFFWYGGGASGNARDFMFTTAGGHNIFGGRFENGQRFMQVGAGSANWAAPINVQGCDIREYAPQDGKLFDLRSAVQLNIQSCNIGGQATPFGPAMITASPALGGFGSVRVADSVVNADDPFYSLRASAWQVSVERVAMNDGNAISQRYFRAPALNTGVQDLIYGPTVTPDPNQGGYCRIAVADAQPFALNAPASASAGTELTFEIANNTRGAMGAVRWNGFRLAGAFVAPAAGHARTISFTYNGAHWMERSRSTADIATKEESL